MKKTLSPLLAVALMAGLTAGMAAHADDSTPPAGAAAPAEQTPAKPVKKLKKSKKHKMAKKAEGKNGCSSANGCDADHKDASK